jgi:hypothetical protein
MKIPYSLSKTREFITAYFGHFVTKSIYKYTLGMQLTSSGALESPEVITIK